MYCCPLQPGYTKRRQYKVSFLFIKSFFFLSFSLFLKFQLLLRHSTTRECAPRSRAGHVTLGRSLCFTQCFTVWTQPVILCVRFCSVTFVCVSSQWRPDLTAHTHTHTHTHPYTHTHTNTHTCRVSALYLPC